MTSRDAAARLIDHTLLRPDVGETDIDALVEEALDLGVFAVCVEGRWVRRILDRGAQSLRVVTVCGFPTGEGGPRVKAPEAAWAVGEGADEIDMVADLDAIRAADWGRVEGDVAEVRAAMDAASAGRVLKVILETAAFDDRTIVEAALAAERGGADFVKTSTGMSPAGGASVGAVGALNGAVGGRLGIKASGGIRTAEGALALLDAGATRLGTSGTRQILSGWRVETPPP